MNEQVQDITSLPKPSKALWKRGLKTVAITTLVALGASAVYQGLKKGSESDAVETPAA